MGSKALHPLVSVIDLAEEAVSRYNYIKCNFYAVLLLEHSCCDYYYGRRSMDYSDGTLIFLTPKKCMELITECDSDDCLNKGKMLIFHKDIITETSLNRHFNTDYRFFRYQDNEALHISEREKQIVFDSLDQIKREVDHDMDCFSESLISHLIAVLLDYCRRFYERQFILRNDENKEKIEKLKTLLADYYQNNIASNVQLPSAKWCADNLEHSITYLNSMLQHQEGMSIQEYIQFSRINIAVDLIMNSEEPVEKISERLGFRNSIYFNRIFKKIAGCLPTEYRKDYEI